MSNVVKFKSRKEQEVDELIDVARGHVAVCKAIMPGTGWKRRRRIVITIFRDGSSDWQDGPKDERTALFVAGIFARKYGFTVVNWGAFS